jgi:prevent-host-death family protein
MFGFMASWQVEDAKARFIEFLEAAIETGPQIVTRGGVEAAVLVPVQEWRRLQDLARRKSGDPLLAPHPRFEGILEDRPKFRRRPVVFE